MLMPIRIGRIMVLWKKRNVYQFFQMLDIDTDPAK
jgi:hypothetical protein